MYLWHMNAHAKKEFMVNARSTRSYQLDTNAHTLPEERSPLQSLQSALLLFLCLLLFPLHFCGFDVCFASLLRQLSEYKARLLECTEATLLGFAYNCVNMVACFT